jgi:hypothetical protein
MKKYNNSNELKLDMESGNIKNGETVILDERNQINITILNRIDNWAIRKGIYKEATLINGFDIQELKDEVNI